MPKDPELLANMNEIIEFTGIPRRTFYDRGYAKNIKESTYVFCRTGRYGRKIYWSYKRLIMAWSIDNFCEKNKKT
jgi:hypothetical protein